MDTLCWALDVVKIVIDPHVAKLHLDTVTCDRSRVPPLFHLGVTWWRHLVLIRFTPRSAPDILGPHAKQGCPSDSSEAQGPLHRLILNLKFEESENPDFKQLES